MLPQKDSATLCVNETLVSRSLTVPTKHGAYRSFSPRYTPGTKDYSRLGVSFAVVLGQHAMMQPTSRSRTHYNSLHIMLQRRRCNGIDMPPTGLIGKRDVIRKTGST